jgi:tRNA-specific adenosine deaminase 1
MTALSNNQSLESFQQFQSGSNKRKRMEEEYPSIIENMYVNKKQKTSTQQFRRGRFEFDQLGILRTKPGIQNDATVVHN